MLKFISRFLPNDDTEETKYETEEAHVKMARVDAEIEEQDMRLSRTTKLLVGNLTAAERLLYAINRDRNQ